MINGVFEVEEIDEYGLPWVSKCWNDKNEGEYTAHSVALESHEYKLVNE